MINNPKMELSIIENPLICCQCRDSMERYVKFLQSCHDTEEKINRYPENEGLGSDKNIQISSKFTLDYAKKQARKVKREKLSMEEVTEVEITNKWCSCNTKDNHCLGRRARSNEALPISKDIKLETVSSEMSTIFKLESEELHIKEEVTLNESLHTQSYVSEIRKVTEVTCTCTPCDFETVDTSDIERHSLTHKTEAEIKDNGSWTKTMIYECSACNYKTIYKRSLQRHSLMHKAKEEATLYKCTTCDFETIHKGNLKNHSLTHKLKTEGPIYKCTTCEFETIYKGNFKSHSLIHKLKEEGPIYKCTTCDYKTVLKRGIQNHLLTHKAKEEVTMYKCMSCNFETLYKSNLKRHSLTHKTEAEVTMYKCSACDFKTKHKVNLKNHSLVHKSEAEVTMYQCTTCYFKTKHKNNLKSHLLTHTEEAEITE